MISIEPSLIFLAQDSSRPRELAFAIYPSYALFSTSILFAIADISETNALLRVLRVLNALSAVTFSLSIASVALSTAIAIRSNTSSNSFSDEEELDLDPLDFDDEEPLDERDELPELFFDEEDGFLLVEDELGLCGLYPPVTIAVPLTRAEARPETYPFSSKLSVCL